jgi:cell division protein FtsL
MSDPAVQIRHRVPRIAEAAVERARLTVVPRARSSAPRVPFVTLVTLLLVGGVVGLLLFNTSMQQASFAATSLEEKAGNLAARQQTLQMELEELRNPQRVAQEAQQMGMVIPAAPAFVTLGGGISGEPTPAAPENALNLKPADPVKPESLTPAPKVVTVRLTPAQARAARLEERAERLRAQARQEARADHGRRRGRG